MAAYAMMGACDVYPSARPTIRRAVTAPDNKPKTADTPQAKPAELKPLPARPFTSPRVAGDPSLPERPLLNERDFTATGSLHPVVAAPSTCHPQQGNALELKLQLSTGIKHALQSVPTPDAIATLSRRAYTALTDLAKDLETHSLFHTFVDPTAVSVLRVNDLSPSEYLELYNLLEPQLEGFRIKIDFHDTTLIMRRPSETHECGVRGWISVGYLLQTQMPMPPEVNECFDWRKGQVDVQLPPLSPGGLRIKCPDACLGTVDDSIPTLVLETGYSQTVGEIHTVAKTWLWRPIMDERVAREDHAVQCVIVFKINENLSKHWLPAFRQAFEKNNFNTNRDLAPDPASFLSKVALQSIALTVEIWRNEKDATTGELKRERTVRNRPTCTIPVCISTHSITTEQLFDTWIWEYLSDVRSRTQEAFHTLQDHTPIPRSTVCTAQQNKYFTLYLDDLTSPKDIPPNRRETVWINVPVTVWVWGYLISQRVGFKGWRSQVAHQSAYWAQLDSGNKENQNARMDMEDVGGVLVDLDVENDQTRVKRRKVQKGL
ncbi:hypothetical protein L211DRAFT_874838 [Terfezia boudieri ATCC MYA-4762]|uniref:Uncharacterized protein n=1 Tax=Terfezia boudieri ATCC MYA-4762 TaxID=1051890 RepID=A0A3N4L6A6_9PEZI|nr:hypothetical protein L211DRAFT_874838 [Terfezia boudieri ATCC MYA-4762]